MTLNDPTIFTAFAHELANEARQISRRYYRSTALSSEAKADSSPVTRADKEIEQRLREMIIARFPEHGIIGEEHGNKAPAEGCPYSWSIDPIDGTKSFMIGRPIFVTMVALLEHDVPVLGLMDQPITEERWLGVQGENSTHNGAEITSNAQVAALQEAVLCTTGPDLFLDAELPAFAALRDACKHTVYGGDGYSYGLLAQGGVDVILEADLKPYDFCALAPIITQAGGVITDWDGVSLTRHSDGRVLACGNKVLHDQALKLVRGYQDL